MSQVNGNEVAVESQAQALQRKLGTMPAQIANELAVAGVVLLIRNRDGSVGISSHGVNHAKCVELLAVGIHMTLSDHDQRVLAGEAGADARAVARSLHNEEG